MNADEDGIRESVRELDPLLERKTAVVIERVISTLNPARCSCIARDHCHFERERLLRSPGILRRPVGAAVARIEHDRLDSLRILDAARTQDRLDELSDIEGGNQMRRLRCSSSGNSVKKRTPLM